MEMLLQSRPGALERPEGALLQSEGLLDGHSVMQFHLAASGRMKQAWLQYMGCPDRRMLLQSCPGALARAEQL